jgi:glucose-6-phosphate isomerase
VWGEAGTNGQHAFYQLLHQGGRLIPAEFIAVIQPDYDLNGHHDKLLANCLAQSEALMRGKSLAEARRETLRAKGDPGVDCYRVFPGNQPSTTLLLPDLTPHTLGQLIALYEHKVFVLGALWNLNAFDQWGVEYGKQLANCLLPALERGQPPDCCSASTRGLLGEIVKRRQVKPPRVTATPSPLASIASNRRWIEP